MSHFLTKPPVRTLVLEPCGREQTLRGIGLHAVQTIQLRLRSTFAIDSTIPSVTKMQETNSTTISRAVIDGAVAAFRSNKGWADKAIAQTSDENLRIAMDANTNSIAVIMKYVAGNLLSRWTKFLISDGEKPWRNRDDEFTDSFASRDELLAYWESGWQRLFETLESLTAEDVEKTVTIRGEPHSVPLAVSRSLAHCGYQIVMIAHILAGDQWTTITIPRGGSGQFNTNVWGAGHYQAPPKDT